MLWFLFFGFSLWGWVANEEKGRKNGVQRLFGDMRGSNKDPS